MILKKESSPDSFFIFAGWCTRLLFVNFRKHQPFRMSRPFLSALFTILLSVFLGFAAAQVPQQRITGTVVDKTSRQPLPGANVFIRLPGKDSTLIGAVSDMDGRFTLEKVPVGRHYLHCTFISYEPWTSRYLELTSAKQLTISVELEPAILLGEEVVVHDIREGSEASNEYGLGSARSFTAEETQRFAGSINDPGRMALSLPGAQISTQDNENTIVVRANSPIGLSWRLEGVEIPNPNHFAEAGSSGGGISALSIYVLGASDFFTGAFPAEYGNALAGVMDLKFRKGNRENREYRFQAGLIGLDFASEGPFSEKKKKASYLFNYRYSTLGILSAMGVNVVNPLTSNTFQDLSFNLSFPVSKKTFITFFGFGGTSAENKVAEADTAKWESFNEVSPYDFYTKLGVTGITYTHLINDRSYIYGVVSGGANHIRENDDTVNADFEKVRIRNERYLNGRVTTAWSYNRRIGNATNFKTGFQASYLFYDVFREDFDNTIEGLRIQMEGKGNTGLLQPYAVLRSQVSRVVTLQGGINTMYFAYTRDFVVEPRVGAQFQLHSGTINFAYGMHSQILPFQTYEMVTTDSLTGAYAGKPNRDLKMWRAHHLAMSFNKPISESMRLKVEPYFQYLFHVPVSIHPWNTYSLINQDRNYFADSLINKGTGYNAGVELTFEKSFSNLLFFLLSGSFYNSQYKTNNGGVDRYYNTKYNSNFNTALTFGKEWGLGNARRLEVGGRILWSGGMRYTPYNTTASIEKGRPVYIYSQAYEMQVKNYFRIDTRVALRKNAERFSWRLSLDIQNLTNYKNPQRPYFDRWTGNIAYGYNTPIIPVISYMIDF